MPKEFSLTTLYCAKCRKLTPIANMLVRKETYYCVGCAKKGA